MERVWVSDTEGILFGRPHSAVCIGIPLFDSGKGVEALGGIAEGFFTGVARNASLRIAMGQSRQEILGRLAAVYGERCFDAMHGAHRCPGALGHGADAMAGR